MEWRSRTRDSDVVEDSEPEREMMRQMEEEIIVKMNLKKKGKTPTGINEIAEIIELSDDEPELLAAPSHPAIALARELSDNRQADTMTGISQPWVANRLPNSGKSRDMSISKASVTESSASLFDNEFHFSQPIPLTTKSVPSHAAKPATVSNSTPALSIATNSNSEDDGNHLKLGHFACKSKVRFAKPSRPKDFSNTAGVPVIDTAKTSKSKKKSGPSPAPEISNADLAKLAKCVSCDTKWTTRKTPTQKMIHVKSCARKKALSAETLRVLILEEIEKAIPADIAAQWKGKGKASDLIPQEIRAPKTFMEDVLNDAAPRKKVKRPEVTKSVRNVVETRDVILDRARAVLGTCTSSDSEEVDLDCQTQIFGPSKLAVLSVIGSPPQTQPFGESAFRRKQTPPSTHSLARSPRMVKHRSDAEGKTALKEFSGLFHAQVQKYGYDHLHDVDCAPSSWTAPLCENDPTLEYFPQSFTPLVDVPSFARDQSRNPPNNKANVKDPAHFGSRYSKELQPNSSLVVRGGEDSDTAHDVYNKWNNDEAFLHFDPETEIQHPPVPRDLSSQEDNRPNNSAITGQSQNFISESSHVPTKQVKSKERYRGGTECPQNKDFDDNLRKTIIDEILNDKTLHLRILRLEPIAFEVFCQLLNEEQLECRGLRIKLRRLLDTLGVNFYGADPQGWNRR